MLKLFKKKPTEESEGEEGEESPYIPFKIRFKAWWEGTDPEIFLAGEAAEAGAAPDGAEGAADTASKGPKAELVKDDLDNSWTDIRLEVCKLLWGGEDEEEVVQPGGTEYTVTLAKPMALNETKSVLDLAAGLGGGTRRLSKDFDLWITGMEMDAQLVEHAAKLSEMHGMTKRAPIESYDQENFTLPEKKYHAILCREALFAIKNKKSAMDKIFNALKPAGDLVFTDYVLKTENSEDNKAVEAWMKSIPNNARPWTMEDYKKRSWICPWICISSRTRPRISGIWYWKVGASSSPA